MIKRQLFFINGNFKLKFIFCYMAVLAAGTASAVYWLYCAARGAVEEAVFSSHLLLNASSELFWPMIIKVNLVMAGVSLLLGFCVIVGIHVYLDDFFHALVQGLDRLAKGDFSCRLGMPGRWWVRRLVNDFNNKAEELEIANAKLEQLIDSLIVTVDTRPADMVAKIKALHDQAKGMGMFKK